MPLGGRHPASECPDGGIAFHKGHGQAHYRRACGVEAVKRHTFKKQEKDTQRIQSTGTVGWGEQVGVQGGSETAQTNPTRLGTRASLVSGTLRLVSCCRHPTARKFKWKKEKKRKNLQQENMEDLINILKNADVEIPQGGRRT